MGVPLVYLRLYGRCVGAAFSGIAKNAWTLALPIGLFVGFTLVAAALLALPVIGGFILGLILNLFLSCYLYFTGGVVAHQKMTLGELKKSALVYFWSVMGLFFVLWIAGIALDFVLASNPNKNVIQTGLDLVALVVLNPAPEVIYLKGTRGGTDTIGRCVAFIQENWIEWFIPNGLLIAGAWWVVNTGLRLLPPGFSLLIALVGGALFHFVMVFRGHLFEVLDGSTHRQRMYKFRNANSAS